MKYGTDLTVVRMGQKSYLDTIERAVSNGDVVLIENLEEAIDPVLDPLLGRNTIKKGRAIKLGDKEVSHEYYMYIFYYIFIYYYIIIIIH